MSESRVDAQDEQMLPWGISEGRTMAVRLFRTSRAGFLDGIVAGRAAALQGMRLQRAHSLIATRSRGYQAGFLSAYHHYRRR